MAELIHTVSFRVGEDTYLFLRGLSDREHRKLGDIVRILVEMAINDTSYEIEIERDPRGKV